MGTEPTPPPRPAGEGSDQDGLLGFVASTLAFAILLGVAVIGASLWVVVALQAGKPPSEVPDTSGPAFTVLVGGTFLGALTAAVATWTLLARIGSAYRRGSFAMVSAFATMAAMLAAIPAHTRFGPAGLVGLVGACAIGCVLLGRRLSRWNRRHG
ncbi:MAG: hypothetical protein HKM89_04470 [Gemmatimonadales bacterium]|nr:hypothetical protein [Gemmatimonadales bacterium]